MVWNFNDNFKETLRSDNYSFAEMEDYEKKFPKH